MSSLILLITTFDDEGAAMATIRKLVEERLVACGTMIPKARSIYCWQGNIEENAEVVVFLKTTRSLQEASMERLKGLHSYEIPEILVIEPTAIEKEYEAWMQQTLDCS